MILCGYTGGYTELGGGEKFLQKIRNDVEYKRLTPATHKRGAKFRRTEQSEISPDDMWFYYDAANIFNNNVLLIKELNNFYAEYEKSEWKYDSSKDSCLKKYSITFADILKYEVC